MSQKSVLQQMAIQIANAALQHASKLEREILDLETQAAQKKALLDSAKLSHQRLRNYRVLIGADYQCPSCWINSETEAPLRPIAGGTSHSDFFRCSNCNREFEIPTGL